MNKKEFQVLREFFNKMKNHEEMRGIKAYQLFLVGTDWGEKIFSNSPTPILSTHIKRFPYYFHEIGDQGYLNADELTDLWSNMSRKKQIVKEFRTSL